MTYQQLLNRYLKKHKRLVEPVQGFGSLHKSLHLAYSMGRKRGFTDLGVAPSTLNKIFVPSGERTGLLFWSPSATSRRTSTTRSRAQC